MNRYINIGTICSMQLDEEDRIDPMRVVLANFFRGNAPSSFCRLKYGKLPDEDDCMIAWGLEDLLQDYAPPRCYVGADPDQEKHYGIWPDFDTIEAEDIPRYSNSADLKNLKQGDEAIVVNHEGHTSYYVRNAIGQFEMVWDYIAPTRS